MDLPSKVTPLKTTWVSPARIPVSANLNNSMRSMSPSPSTSSILLPEGGPTNHNEQHTTVPGSRTDPDRQGILPGSRFPARTISHSKENNRIVCDPSQLRHIGRRVVVALANLDGLFRKRGEVFSSSQVASTPRKSYHRDNADCRSCY